MARLPLCDIREFRQYVDLLFNYAKFLVPTYPLPPNYWKVRTD